MANDNASTLSAKLKREPDFVSEKEQQPGKVQIVVRVDLPTTYGDFILCGVHDGIANKAHTVLLRGNVAGQEACPVRIHSECHTGDVWTSLRCDCRKQLEAAMRYIAKQPAGAIVYLRQEGRGIGLLNKLRAYQLQELGLDTIEANQYLGYPADLRNYRVASEIVSLLGIASVSLISNNPDKIEQLQSAGITVVNRIPLKIPPSNHNQTYLETKKNRMGHLF